MKTNKHTSRKEGQWENAKCNTCLHPRTKDNDAGGNSIVLMPQEGPFLDYPLYTYW